MVCIVLPKPISSANIVSMPCPHEYLNQFKPYAQNNIMNYFQLLIIVKYHIIEEQLPLIDKDVTAFLFDPNTPVDVRTFS